MNKEDVKNIFWCKKCGHEYLKKENIVRKYSHPIYLGLSIPLLLFGIGMIIISLIGEYVDIKCFGFGLSGLVIGIGYLFAYVAPEKQEMYTCKKCGHKMYYS